MVSQDCFIQSYFMGGVLCPLYCGVEYVPSPTYTDSVLHDSHQFALNRVRSCCDLPEADHSTVVTLPLSQAQGEQQDQCRDESISPQEVPRKSFYLTYFKYILQIL